jgi:hypothetical protein
VLGSLPEGFRHILAWNETLQIYTHAFVNDVTGEVSRDDPRLEALSVDINDYRQGPEENSLDVDPEDLRDHGVDIKYFELI